VQVRAVAEMPSNERNTTKHRGWRNGPEPRRTTMKYDKTRAPRDYSRVAPLELFRRRVPKGRRETAGARNRSACSLSDVHVRQNMGAGFEGESAFQHASPRGKISAGQSRRVAGPV